MYIEKLMKIAFYIVLLSFPIFTLAQQKDSGVYWNLDHQYNPAFVPKQKFVYDFLDSLYINRKNLPELYKHFKQTDIDKWSMPEMIGRIVSVGANDSIENFYKPDILGIMNIDNDQKYLAKIAFVSHDSSRSSVQVIYNLIINLDTNNNATISNYTDWITQTWYKTKIGSFTFYKQSKEVFNVSEAKRLDSFNVSIAKIFEKPIKTYTYYSCLDPFQLFQIRGFDYNPRMFYARNGGFLFNKNIVFSGSNTEYYPHEVAHAYTADYRTDNSSRISDEGIVSYLGGSGGLNYKDLLKQFKHYILQNNLKITSFLTEDSDKNISEDVSTLYALGSLIAKLSYDKYGLSGWKTFLDTPENKMNDFLMTLGNVTSSEVENYLLKELSKY